MPLCKGGKCSPSAWGSEMFAVPEEGKREGGKRCLLHPHILPPRRFAAIRKRSMNHPPDTRAYCGIGFRQARALPTRTSIGTRPTNHNEIFRHRYQ